MSDEALQSVDKKIVDQSWRWRVRPNIGSNLIETIKNCNGFYQTPKSQDGKRLGPLVGYAGKYDAGDGTEKHYVGEIFFNCAKLEQWPGILASYAENLRRCYISGLDGYHNFPVFLGAPMGGITFAQALARADGCARAIYAEKKIIEVQTPTQREQSTLVLDRHTLSPGDRVIITEDVVNNFSTTDKVIELILEAGAVPIGIACLIDRSSRTSYQYGDLNLPIVACEHSPTAQYRQDDPYVAAEIAANNVVWKPKDRWSEIQPFIQ